jgi:hypothetical protein
VKVPLWQSSGWEIVSSPDWHYLLDMVHLDLETTPSRNRLLKADSVVQQYCMYTHSHIWYEQKDMIISKVLS